VEDIFESLEWLGMSWDEGPQNATEHYNTFSQQSRMERYHAFAEQLKNNAACFYCSCPRSAKEGCSCYGKGMGWKLNEIVLKIKTASDGTVSFFDEFAAKEIEVNLDAEMKDFVIWRKDGIPSYQLASLADDLEYGTNLVVRGQDLISSTGAQLFLAQKLRRNEFAQARFFHHTLRPDAHGKKLSKSAGSESLKNMRQRGVAATEIYRQFAAWMGWKSVPDNLTDLLHLLAENGLAMKTGI
jgi:glutamyl-tRNA synthetase